MAIAARRAEGPRVELGGVLIPLAIVLAAAPAWTEPNSRELAIFPFTARLGEYSARQYAFAADLAWPVADGITVTLRGHVDYPQLARDESFCNVVDCRDDVQRAASVMLAGAAFLGFELSPAPGEIVFYDFGPAKLGLVLGAGLGAAATRVKINNAGFLETGWHFAAQFGGGVRVQIANWITVRLELRDVVFSSKVDRVNGCSSSDLKVLDNQLRAGTFTDSTRAARTCNIGGDSVPLAYALTRASDGNLIHTVQLHVGLGLAF